MRNDARRLYHHRLQIIFDKLRNDCANEMARTPNISTGKCNNILSVRLPLPF